MKECLNLEKRKVRYDVLNLRNTIDSFSAKAYSNAIFSKIEQLPAYKDARNVMFYMSYGSEVFTDWMIQSALKSGKNVSVPSINISSQEMVAISIFKLEDANELVYGIRQPVLNSADIVKKEDIDLVFVPAIAFDEKGYRTGYGKGYYDKWLEGVPVEKTIGIAYDFQVLKEVPIEKFDLPVGMIITEKRIIEPKKI